MSKPIIEVRNVSKSYKIGAKQEPYLSLRDSITQFGKSILGQQKETFWALKDISFDVYSGECIGIIGRNGAGKSTLLKILSRITPPTSGSITMRGRVASLLEVGTGFHPELTGRENIYLNGSILGMNRKEINAQFDAIVDFSGVEQFLETPLKHYSSGMQLRLAFAVAAHLNPEILLIDEVLAVGDAEFQKKCLGKMDEVSKSGRTVIFVSHDLAAVRQLCSKSILLSDQSIVSFSDTENTIFQYEKIVQGSKMKQNEEHIIFHTHCFSLIPSLKEEDSILSIDIKFKTTAIKDIVQSNIIIRDRSNKIITLMDLKPAFYDVAHSQNDKNKFTLSVELNILNWVSGDYYINFTIESREKGWSDILEKVFSKRYDNKTIQQGYPIEVLGFLHPQFRYEIK